MILCPTRAELADHISQAEVVAGGVPRALFPAARRLRWIHSWGTGVNGALHPELVEMDRAVHHEPASFPPYDVYPVKPEWTPASGTLSSPRDASREKGEILLDVCTRGIIAALRSEFAPAG